MRLTADSGKDHAVTSYYSKYLLRCMVNAVFVSSVVEEKFKKQPIIFVFVKSSSHIVPVFLPVF